MFRLAMTPAVALELNRHVADFEFRFQHLMHIREHAILVGIRRDYRMRRERELD